MDNNGKKVPLKLHEIFGVSKIKNDRCMFNFLGTWPDDSQGTLTPGANVSSECLVPASGYPANIVFCNIDKTDKCVACGKINSANDAPATYYDKGYKFKCAVDSKCK